jgi:hypothetical protein
VEDAGVGVVVAGLLAGVLDTAGVGAGVAVDAALAEESAEAAVDFFERVFFGVVAVLASAEPDAAAGVAAELSAVLFFERLFFGVALASALVVAEPLPD